MYMLHHFCWTSWRPSIWWCDQSLLFAAAETCNIAHQYVRDSNRSWTPMKNENWNLKLDPDWSLPHSTVALWVLARKNFCREKLKWYLCIGWKMQIFRLLNFEMMTSQNCMRLMHSWSQNVLEKFEYAFWRVEMMQVNLVLQPLCSCVLKYVWFINIWIS